VTYLLSCGHTGIVAKIEELNSTMVCPKCGYTRKLVAVETREWHVKCQSGSKDKGVDYTASVCRYGRWYGQDKMSADFAAKDHFARHGHSCSVDYQKPTERRYEIRKMFGRTVKTHIVTDRWHLAPDVTVTPPLRFAPDPPPDKPPF
jgi:hypothetical protein